MLLGTHVALWTVAGSESLAAQAQAAILATEEVFVSAASLREIGKSRSSMRVARIAAGLRGAGAAGLR